MLTFDPDSLLVELLVSSVGGALLVYGKKAERWPHVIAGILLIAYPYVVSGTAAMLGIGAAIVGGLILAIRLGW